MKNPVLFIILLLSAEFSYAQNINIRIAGLGEKKAALFSLSGEKVSFIDSVEVSPDKEFVYNLKKHNPGIYRLILNSNTVLNFIYDNEDVGIETDAGNVSDSLRVIKSGSNKIYYEFTRLNKVHKTKSDLLQLMLARYPEKDDYFQATAEKMIRLQKDYLYFINENSQANPNSFIARYIRTARLPVIDVNVPVEKQLYWLKSHSLDNVDFSDEGLIYSDAFTNKTIEYLSYYRNPQLPKELLEKEFETAIDTLLNKAKVNEIVYTHIAEYLLDGFKKFGFDNVIDYIVENYVIKDDLCLDQKFSSALDRRIRQAKSFKAGTEVPDIILPDSTGSIITLAELKTDKTLIIFYASWCPHCQKLLPEIYELYKEQKVKKFEVIAISIDTSRTDWLNFVKQNNLDWINISDLKGWDGQAVLDYYIYATPTMFLVNKELKIVGLPKNIEELK